MRILIYGINYAPELTGIGKYSGEMAEWFAEQGHDVRVITAPPYYPQWRVALDYSAKTYQRQMINGVTVFRCPLFVPKTPKTLSRLLHLLSFAAASLPVMLMQWRWRPDVVMSIEPTFFCTPATLCLAKLCGAKSILHIQDYELDAMLGLGMGKQGKFSAFSQGIERFIMRRFSTISSISVSMLKRASEKMHSHPALILFPNWVDITFVTPETSAAIFRQKWRIAESTKVVLYSGNIGKKQGLEMALNAAATFNNKTDIVFLFVGTGAAVSELQEKARELALKNTFFYPLQPYEKLPNLMALADVHLVVQKKGVADAVLPSKLTTILSAGGSALITAEKDTELGLLCDNYPGIALCVGPENIDAFTTGLNYLLSQIDVSKRTQNTIARNYAETYLAKEQILRQFESDLQNLGINTSETA